MNQIEDKLRFSRELQSVLRESVSVRLLLHVCVHSFGIRESEAYGSGFTRRARCLIVRLRVFCMVIIHCLSLPSFARGHLHIPNSAVSRDGNVGDCN